MRFVTLGALSAATLIALSGCTNADLVDPLSPSSSESSSITEPSSSPSSSATLKGTKLNLECLDILSLEDVYEFNPNYGSDPGFTPEGTPSDMVSIGGVACGWVNQTSGDTFSVSVAQPDTASRDLVLNATANMFEAVPTYGTPPEVEGYFGLESGVGVATVFSGDYWIELRSEAFFEPGDVTPLVEMVIDNL